jgi:membrane associated rhomboid family serine protease
MVDFDNYVEPRKEPPAFNIPPIVLALIVAMLGAFALFNSVSFKTQEDMLVLFALFPARFIAPAAHPDIVFPGGVLGDLWTLISYTFMHGSWMHVTVNSIWLLAFGSPVARRIGAVRFALLYFFCGIVGGLLHVVMNGGSLIPVVGASGAISGLMGAAARFVFLADGPLGGLTGRMGRSAAPRAQSSVWAALSDRRVLIFVGVWIGLNFLFGLSGITMTGGTANIAWEAHLGGFLAGLFFFGFFDPCPRSSSGGPGNVDYGEWSGRDRL